MSRARTSLSSTRTKTCTPRSIKLMDKLDRQVCRHKDRVQDHHHASAKRIDASLS